MTGAGQPASERSRLLHEERLGAVVRAAPGTLQLNLGDRCNMACRHCHVDAGPGRRRVMGWPVAERALALLAASPSVTTLDLTGGAPELAPCFRHLVREARRVGREVIDRCNLTILLEPGMEDLPSFLAAHQVRIVASLPCYTAANVDRQRGARAFERSIEALRRLNRLGYGLPGSPLGLDLVYNPGGAFLPPAQDGLERTYERELRERHSIRFHCLLTMANMPLARFERALARGGQLEEYRELLRDGFNPATVGGLMCRSLVSVGWDGRLYDCDFNQMAGLPLGADPDGPTLWDLGSLEELTGRPVATAEHCFGCTAGAGSGCSGALDG